MVSDRSTLNFQQSVALGGPDQLRVAKLTDYTAEIVRSLFARPEDVRACWVDAGQRADIIRQLGERGIDFAQVAAQAGQPDADPLDLLCHLAFNAPILQPSRRPESPSHLPPRQRRGNHQQVRWAGPTPERREPTAMAVVCRVKNEVRHHRLLVGDQIGDCPRVRPSVFTHSDKPSPSSRLYQRGLCLLDPYGLHLDWSVIQMAGQMETIEIFLNFPVADMNRNVLWRDSTSVDPQQAARMTAFWGDESWKQAAYSATGNLFGWPEKQTNDEIAETFRQRLQKVARFRHVPEPIPMRNTKGAIVYYLFFASPKPVAAKIVTDIFGKYRNKGSV